MRRYRYARCARPDCPTVPDDGHKLCPAHLAPQRIRKPRPEMETTGVHLVVGHMKEGAGERDDGCEKYTLCLLRAGRKGGSWHCPAGCAERVAIDRAAELDEMATSRAPITAAVGGGGWRAPTTRTGAGS
jgi:hypothetical protein